ncbi:hypothetical protein LTR55_012459, partial [Exophiala xenobiotica]
HDAAEARLEQMSAQHYASFGAPALKSFALQWLIDRHPLIRPDTLKSFANEMVSVSVLARVARAYGMEEKLLAHNPAELSNLATKPHILAGTFEAHIGMYFAQVMDGTMPFTVLKEYLSELFDSEMFADLRMRLEAAHKANLDQEQDVSSSKADTTAANPPN